MANPIAVPGTNVPSGAAVSPGGAQGPTAVSANANNKATLGSDSLVLVQGTAAGVAATTHTQTVSGDDPQLTNARTPTAHEASHVTGSDQIPLASSSTKGLLNQTSGNTTDFIDGTNNSQPLQPVIWSARLRSFNAIGNCNFECRQRNVGNAINNPLSGNFIEDRWASQNGGSVNPGFQAISVAGGPASAIPIPGMTFPITTGLMRISVGTQKASLSAGDNVGIQQTVEGPGFRELSNDVHSISVLARSTVANLSFGVALRDPTASRSLTKLCTLGAASTWVLFTLPNLPIWPAAGTFTSAIGSAGYLINVTVAAGSTYTSPSNDVWNTGNYAGAAGQGNLLASAAGSYVDIAFIQHEPGAPTTPIDRPFTQNYDECLRYYQKSYDYGTALGAVTTNGTWSCSAAPASHAINPLPFQKRMAKVPSFNMRSTATGAFNVIRDSNAAVDRTVTGTVNLGEAGCGGVTIGSTNAAATYYYGQWVADTGW